MDEQGRLRRVPVTRAWIETAYASTEEWLRACPVEAILAERQNLIAEGVELVKSIELIRILLELRDCYVDGQVAGSTLAVPSGSFFRARLLTLMTKQFQWRSGELVQALNTNPTRLSYTLHDLVEEGLLQRSGWGVYRLAAPTAVVASALRTMETP